MPSDMPIPTNQWNMRCAKSNQNGQEDPATACAGKGTPPDYVNGVFDGDLDFFRLNGQWYKISNGYFKIDRGFFESYIQAVGGPWPRVLWNADGISLQLYYGIDGKAHTTATTEIDYVNRIKREVHTLIPSL